MEENFYDKSEEITELTFKDLICKENDIKLKEEPILNGILVLYTPWCSKCSSMITFWENISNIFKHKIKVQTYNTYNHSAKNEKLGKYIKLDTYPKYFIFHKENNDLIPADFSKESDIENWISLNSF